MANLAEADVQIDGQMSQLTQWPFESCMVQVYSRKQTHKARGATVYAWRAYGHMPLWLSEDFVR